jgi:hypothetical protein
MKSRLHKATNEKSASLAYDFFRYSQFWNILSLGGEVALCLDPLEWNSEY